MGKERNWEVATLSGVFCILESFLILKKMSSDVWNFLGSHPSELCTHVLPTMAWLSQAISLFPGIYCLQIWSEVLFIPSPPVPHIPKEFQLWWGVFSWFILPLRMFLSLYTPGNICCSAITQNQGVWPLFVSFRVWVLIGLYFVTWTSAHCSNWFQMVHASWRCSSSQSMG